MTRQSLTSIARAVFGLRYQKGYLPSLSKDELEKENEANGIRMVMAVCGIFAGGIVGAVAVTLGSAPATLAGCFTALAGCGTWVASARRMDDFNVEDDRRLREEEPEIACLLDSVEKRGVAETAKQLNMLLGKSGDPRPTVH